MLHYQFLGIGLALLLLVAPVFAQQQPATPSCEDLLAQSRAQLEIVSTGRAQGEYVIADALAAVRKQRDQLQAEVKGLQEQLTKTKETASTGPIPPATEQK